MLRRLTGLVLALAASSTMMGAALAAPPPPNAREAAMLESLQKPDEWIIEQLKGPLEVVDGQTLHPKIQWFQEQRGRTPQGRAVAKQQEDLMATPEGRAGVRRAVERTWNYRTKVTAEMAAVDDRTVAGRGGEIPVRIYRPVTEAKGPLPVLVYFHGGAWLFGNIEAVDRAMRLIANEAGVIVVSADYRLAPEFSYPAPQDDAQDVFIWTTRNIAQFGGDPAVIAIGGDSAGGQLAMSVSMRQQKAKAQMPLYQLLYYPAVDMVSTDYESYRLFGQGYGLDTDLAEYVFRVVYPDPAIRKIPEVSPVRAKSLKGMPPTIIASAGFDILRDQHRDMALKLEKDGVIVNYLFYPSLTHGFMQHSGTIDDAEYASVETARLLGDALRGRALLLRH